MNTIPMNTPADFECVCCDLLNDYIDTFTEQNGLLQLGFDGLELTERGKELYSRYVERLTKIGQRLFPGATMTIEASWLSGPPDEGLEYEDGFPITTFCG